jgi:5-methylcytosine-specific restriction endonuclease McrA
VANKTPPGNSKLDKIVAGAREHMAKREREYREQALKMYPWVCGRCGRSFTSANVRELTVHHRDHNHDNNPADGSNWELLCLYCHDNEHSRYIDATESDRPVADREKSKSASHKPFADLAKLLKKE